MKTLIIAAVGCLMYWIMATPFFGHPGIPEPYALIIAGVFILNLFDGWKD